MIKVLRSIYFNVLVRFITLFVLGQNVRHPERLPSSGPAILVANHNSHLDTMVLITLLPPRLLPRIKPVAALDYFLKNRLLAWFALNIIAILPIKRGRPKRGEDPFADINTALSNGDILILFPEGSRGKPEQLSAYKKGVARIAENNPDVPVIPVFLHGLGKALPKGEALLVPFFCDVFVGEEFFWSDSRLKFMDNLDTAMTGLAGEGNLPPWD